MGIVRAYWHYTASAIEYLKWIIISIVTTHSTVLYYPLIWSGVTCLNSKSVQQHSRHFIEFLVYDFFCPLDSDVTSMPTNTSWLSQIYYRYIGYKSYHTILYVSHFLFSLWQFSQPNGSNSSSHYYNNSELMFVSVCVYICMVQSFLFDLRQCMYIYVSSVSFLGQISSVYFPNTQQNFYRLVCAVYYIMITITWYQPTYHIMMSYWQCFDICIFSVDILCHFY